MRTGERSERHQGQVTGVATRVGHRGGWLPLANTNGEAAEVCVAVFVEQDAAGIDSPMDDAVTMRGCQRGSDLPEEPGHRVAVPGSPPQRAAEGAAAHPARDQEGSARFPPVVVERQDVGVFQPGDERGVGREAPGELGVGGEVGPGHLQRDLPSHGGLVGAVHDAEAPFTEAFPQFVAADGAARSELGGCRWRLGEVEAVVVGKDAVLQLPECR